MSLVAVLLTAGAVNIQAQGLIDGFMRGQGNATVALSFSTESYDQFYIGTEENDLPAGLGEIGTQSVNLYAAVGVFDNLDVVFALPYIMAESSPAEGAGTDESGLQDASLLVKWKPWSLNVNGLGEVFAVLAAGISTPAADYTANAPVAIGHYYTQAETRLLVGARLDNGLFGNIQVGYYSKGEADFDVDGVEMSAAVPDALDFVAKVGFAHSDFYVDGWLQNQDSRMGPDIMQGPFPIQEISFLRAGVNVYIPIKVVEGLGVSAGMSSTLDGQNIGKAVRFSGGVVYDMNIW